MDVCGAILKGFPDDLVHELDHTGFLIPLGYFLVFADDKLDGLILFQFIQGLRADSVIFFESLVDFYRRCQTIANRA